MFRCGLILCCVTILYGETIACLGDSLTAGFGLAPAEAWPAEVARLAARDHLPWKLGNAGLSGDTSSGALRRLPKVLKAKPQWVVVCIGGNDGLRGIDPTLTEANLRTIIQTIRAAGARPLLVGMQLPPNLGAEYCARFAAIYPAVAQAEDVPLLPFLLEGVGGVAELNQDDGIHPSAEGQRRIAATVYAFLQTQLAAP